MTWWHRTRSSTALTVVLCMGIVVSMVGLSYAAVPLYRLFCQVTGYGGTTQVSDRASEATSDRTMTVRFDANTAPDLAWRFRPETHSLDVRLGENALAFYQATSQSRAATTGTATFNVTPLAAGQYFNKVECFCFTEQTLAAGESAELPVSFFIDPALADDPDLDGVRTITLSYTYFAANPGS